MSNILEKTLRNIKKFDKPKLMSDLVNQAIRLNEKEIIELNTKEQIYKKGIKSDGSKIKPTGKPYSIYSDRYTKFKKKKGKYQGYVDLNLTGKYLESYHILYLFEKIVIEAKDIILSRGFNLSDWLKEYYTNEIEGFTKENLIKIGDIILPDLSKLILKELK